MSSLSIVRGAAQYNSQHDQPRPASQVSNIQASAWRINSPLNIDYNCFRFPAAPHTPPRHQHRPEQELTTLLSPSFPGHRSSSRPSWCSQALLHCLGSGQGHNIVSLLQTLIMQHCSTAAHVTKHSLFIKYYCRINTMIIINTMIHWPALIIKSWWCPTWLMLIRAGWRPSILIRVAWSTHIIWNFVC